MSVAVLVPVLGRPHRIEPTIRSVWASIPDARVLFIADPDDWAELEMLDELGVDYIEHAGSYAAKINEGVRFTDEPVLFFGADDLHWTPGWFGDCMAWVDQGYDVVGVNDLCSRRTQRGEHATHFLVTRSYAEAPTIDGTPGPLHEGYDHSCVDDELIAVARHRGRLVIDPSIVVEHLHRDNGRAPDDETYRKGRARLREDRKLFRRREHLWT